MFLLYPIEQVYVNFDRVFQTSRSELATYVFYFYASRMTVYSTNCCKLVRFSGIVIARLFSGRGLPYVSPGDW